MAGQGIPAGKNTSDFFPQYAYADFKHDFSAPSDKITTNALNTIETQGSRKNFVAKISKLVGSTPFAAFKDKFALSVPMPAAVKQIDDITEDALLKFAEVPYTETVETVGEAIYTSDAKARQIEIAGQFTRNYTVSSVVEKLKSGSPYVASLANQKIPPAGRYVNLLSSLWAVSGSTGKRKTKFVIMYDAATVGISDIAAMENEVITSLLAKDASAALFGETFNDMAPYEVYFVNSAENVRDPASKIVKRTFKSKQAPNVNVYFLNDYGHSSQYTMHSRKREDDVNANLFSKYTLKTTRDKNTDKVRGIVEYERGGSRQIDDVKKESEIGSSTNNALSIFLESGEDYDRLTPNTSEKIMSCFLLKRSGDWCQALCLLDKTRVYTIEGSDRNDEETDRDGATITLQALEDENAEIMLMTHDRILLAYGLALGVNVCFTNNRPTGHWITYFKNEDVYKVDDAAELLRTANVLLRDIASQQTASTAKRASIRKELKKPLDITTLPELRKNAYILANLIPDTLFVTHRNDIQSLIARAKAPAGPENRADTRWMNFSQTLGSLRSLIPNVKSTLDISLRFTTMATYPDEADERETLANLLLSLTTSRPFKSSQKNAEGKTYNLDMAFVLLAERLTDDLRSSVERLPSIPADSAEVASMMLDGKPPSRTQSTIVRNVFEIFEKTAKKSLPLAVDQRGGGKWDTAFIKNGFYLLTRLAVPIVENPDTYDGIGFAQGSRVMHYDGYTYFVYDNYIITKEFALPISMHLDTMRNILMDAERSKEPSAIAARDDDELQVFLRYVTARYIVVLLDVLYNDYVSHDTSLYPTRHESAVVGEDVYRLPEDIVYEETLRILARRTEWLQKCIREFPKATEGFTVAFFTQLLNDPTKRDVMVDEEDEEGLVAKPRTAEDTVGPLYASVAALAVRPLGRVIYQLETAPLPPTVVAPPAGDYAILFDTLNPRNIRIQPIGEGVATYRGAYILDTPDGSFQSIGTGIYVTLGRGLPVATDVPDVLLRTSTLGRRGRSEGDDGIPATKEQRTFGGLRPRRPLYSNDPIPPPVRLLTDDDSGLRERSRTRRTRRIQQSTRKSKTRR